MFGFLKFFLTTTMFLAVGVFLVNAATTKSGLFKPEVKSNTATKASPKKTTVKPVQKKESKPADKKAPVKTSRPSKPGPVLVKDPAQTQEVLKKLSVKRDKKAEQKNLNKLKKETLSLKVELSGTEQAATVNFLTYGISNQTKKLGPAERKDLMSDYLQIFGSEIDWADVQLMASGFAPLNVDSAWEYKQSNIVNKVLTKILGRDPDLKKPKDRQAWETIMYRLRFSKDSASDKKGINQFNKLFGHLPKNAFDWSVMRAIGYVL